ncbi:hypothetical protein [Mycobacterium sp. 1274761.0]|uniref:hypothetical protein n=1 Tax=Mycobacterium sp. 1274761.0 TaxID=1834077 RepID=UPI0007FD9B27|nr:hypothetical protein [Mycobacterium sp. 1274761.0]OBK75017.1 hypothetical protein A5651_09115 [Mycobacterium sp. 1274761.0]
MVDGERTAEASTEGSGLWSDAAPTDESTARPGAAQTEAQDEARQQSTTPAKPDLVGEPDSGIDATKFDFGAWLKTNWVPILLVILLFVTIGAVLYGLQADNNDPIGKVCNGAAVPLLSIAIGYYGNRFFHGKSEKENLRRDVQMATYTTLHTRHSVEYVDERLKFAIAHLLVNGSADAALLELVSAKTATEIAFGMTQQSARQFELISPHGAAKAKDIFTADNPTARPKIIRGDNPKSVATSKGTTTQDGDGENE